MKLLLFSSSIFLLLCFSCKSDAQQEEQEIKKTEKPTETSPPLPLLEFKPFDRTVSLNRIKGKIEADIPLVVHVFVPLCDNEHQGIVPVNERLGDGLNLRSNLYWGAKYGVKNHFKVLKNWKLVESFENPTNDVLERVVFYRIYGTGKKVFLVADAYRGDRMKACLLDYFNALAGNKVDSCQLDDSKVGIYKHADLLVFNGHNGLMDVSIDPILNSDGIIKDAAVIGCVSDDYFQEPLNFAKGYPVLTTTNLLAPEAYVLAGLLDNWVQLKTGDSFKKCSRKGLS